MDKEKDDQYYLNLVINGDAMAFASLVDRYKDMIYSLALKMVKDQQEAEEIAQDAFIKTYKSLRSFKGESKFSTWLYRVAYNTCLDHLKKRKKESSTLYLEDIIRHQEKSFAGLTGDGDEQDIQQQIQDCLDRLPAEEAFLMTLYYYDDLSTEEIATVVGSNSNNIKVRLFRTRKKLAMVLKDRLAPEILAYYERERR